ncbi:MAG TPA: hypothetical protein DHW40_01370 [Microbacterium sp.]|nr:hypothetical protein [Microbacterium sp.]
MSEHDVTPDAAKPSQAEGEDLDRGDVHEVIPAEGHPSQAEGEDTSATEADDAGSAVEDPEDRGAPVAESHIEVSEHDGRTRVDIADDAEMRPGPGPGQPEAD